MKYSLLILILFAAVKLNAQEENEESSSRIWSIHVHYAGQWPEGDMKERYGFNSNAGIGGSFTTKSGWVLEGDFNYIFGTTVKIEDSLFADIVDADGFILDGNGQLAEVYTYERGYYAMLGIGKILPVLKANENSGLTISLGAGFMQHKIRVYNPEETAAQVCGEYIKGYDYLSNGFALRQFIGYTFFATQKVYSFKAGFEIVEGFTQGRRDYLFPIKGPDTQKRMDILYGFKVIYTLPFYKNEKDTYYY
ncbi:MAG: hypothetical protein JXR53_03505 [Bacteroidales bacterium]|nr:hypothetical protein [Bacteroidales bacterium]